MTTRDDLPKPRPLEKPKSAAAQDRLAAALRENLRRRKAQERAREASDAPPPKKDP
jgi:hypothetical protein